MSSFFIFLPFKGFNQLSIFRILIDEIVKTISDINVPGFIQSKIRDKNDGFPRFFVLLINQQAIIFLSIVFMDEEFTILVAP